ncbi:MAG TPA: hypothetical protein VJK02_11435 [Anaerolineales bacterium]|jgi:hypothetical protein|nr:hypothetical protein [Anaerolineales bacterium]
MSMKVFEPDPSAEEWEVVEEATRPPDGATLRRWFRRTYDVSNQLQHTQDRYEIIRDEEMLETEFHEAAPYLTWHLVSEALALVENAGFVDLSAKSDLTPEPATDVDTSYVVLGIKP